MLEYRGRQRHGDNMEIQRENVKERGRDRGQAEQGNRQRERQRTQRQEREREREAERKQAFVVSVEPLFPCLKG